MTESIKFGPEWLRNSVANVSTSNNNTSSLAPSSADITCRPVLSDHRYGREEMLSLCDKSTRLPDVLTRFRRLYVVDWQTPLALQPNTDDDRGSLGSSTTWGTSHIRPLMPGMGRGTTGIIRGGSIERGRGRGRGLYHGSAGGGYTRSTSLYDEEGRRTNLWLDRNGVGGGGETTEWGGNGTSVSPRKDYSSRGMENWRKGTRDENGATTGGGGGVGEVDWRSSNNGTREKWARSTSWRDGDASEPPLQQSSASPPSVNQAKPPVPYKKSWGEEDHLPEWATESFDYGGTFDSSGAFHDASKDEAKKEVEQQPPTVLEEDVETSPEVNHAPTEPQKFLDFNGGAAIDRMKEVADLVANLIMEDEPKDVKVAPPLTAPALIDWFYLDPQGDTQGPFSAQDMSEWYKAGYFQESLMVRRSIDGAFMPLGQLVKVYGRNAPFMQPQVMEPPNPPAFMFEKPQNFVEKPQVVFQPQPQHNANNWNMMTPEQQILLLNMRLAHQRPPVPPQPIDPYRMGNAGDFYQPPPPPVVQQQQQQQDMDPIQQLLMQLQKTGGQETQQQQQWMKPVANEMMNHNHNPPVPVNNWNQQPQQPQQPISMWDMPPTAKMEQTPQSIQVQQHEKKEVITLLPDSEREMVNGGIEHQQQQQQQQFQAAPTSKGNKKKQKEAPGVKDSTVAPIKQQQQQPQLAKKKSNEKPREKKEERTTQPAAPAPWVGHQAPSGGASLAKIQKTETQRRQEIQRERDLHKNVEPKPEKNDGLKWAAPPTARVKTLDEIQAEEQVQATAAQAKREAAKKEAATVVVNDAMIWNSTPHSMAWQQPKVWSGEQTSGSGFWEEPTKPTNGAGAAKMLSKSQTMATITTNKKQSSAPPSATKKQPVPSKRPLTSGEKREKKDDNNNEFTSWCTRTLSQMNGEVDVPTFVSFLQDIESPFEVKDYIKMYLGETKDCAEFAKQFLERRSKQRNQQRLQNAHIDDMCSPAPAITPSVGGLSTEFQEVKGKNKKVKVKKVMKVIDGRALLGFTATSASDRINVGDRDYGEI